MNKGDIWIVEIPESNGHEQVGTRPVIIIADTKLNVVIIIPFTSNIQALRFPYTLQVKPSAVNGLKTESVALVFQVRAIDKKRLKKKIGLIEKSIMERINKTLRELLDL